MAKEIKTNKAKSAVPQKQQIVWAPGIHFVE